MEGPWLRVCAGEGGGGGGGAGGVFRGSRRGTVTGVLHGMPHLAGACLTAVKCARDRLRQNQPVATTVFFNLVACCTHSLAKVSVCVFGIAVLRAGYKYP